MYAHIAEGRLQDASEDLQECAFAGSVFADDAEGLTPVHIKGDVVERPEVSVEALALKRQDFTQPVSRAGVDRIALGDAAKLSD